MGKLRDLYLNVIAAVRSRLPPAAIEAEGEDGVTWATPSASVILIRKPGTIVAQTLTADLTTIVGPTTFFATDSNKDEVAAFVLERLQGRWPQDATFQLAPIPQAGAVCGTHARGGIDAVLISTFQRIEGTHYWLRDHTGPLEVTTRDPETAMLQRYLLYLSMLVDNASASLMCLGVHGLDPGVIVQERLLAEYAVRSHYAVRHPDYTLWATTINEAEDLRKRLVATGADPTLIATVTSERDTAIAAYPQLAQVGKDNKWHRLTVKAMFEEIATTEQHVNLYKYPSSLLHGDAVGMRTMFRTKPDGSVEGVNRLENAALNGDLVDSAMMMVEFLKAFRSAFALLASAADVEQRIGYLEHECTIQSLRFPEGRPSQYLQEVRSQLGL